MARLGGDEFGIVLPVAPRRRRRGHDRASACCEELEAPRHGRGARARRRGEPRDRDLPGAEPGRGDAAAASGRGDVRGQGRRAAATSCTRPSWTRHSPSGLTLVDAGPSGARDAASSSLFYQPKVRLVGRPRGRRRGARPVGAPRARAGPAGRVHPARGEDRPAPTADATTSLGPASASTGVRGRTRAWRSPWRSTCRRGACSTRISPIRSRRSCERWEVPPAFAAARAHGELPRWPTPGARNAVLDELSRRRGRAVDRRLRDRVLVAQPT